jgi:hypothetical protein
MIEEECSTLGHTPRIENVPRQEIASNNRSGRSSDSRTTGVDMAITFNHSRQGSPQQLKSLRLGCLVKIARKVSGRVILERLLAPFRPLAVDERNPSPARLGKLQNVCPNLGYPGWCVTRRRLRGADLYGPATLFERDSQETLLRGDPEGGCRTSACKMMRQIGFQ